MKKKWMRFTSMLMAILMVLSMSITAFADDEKGSITIDGYAGEEYTIYQILDLKYAVDQSGNPTSYSYTVLSDWAEFLEEYNDYFTLTTVDGVTYVDTSSAIFSDNAGGLDLAEFAKAAIAYAETEEIEGQTKIAIAETGAEPDDNGMTKGSVTFSNLNLGYYVVNSTIGTVCSLDTTNPTVTIKDKNEVPVVHKYLVDTDYDEKWDATGDEDEHKKDEGDNNDTMEYKLVVDNVGNIKNLVIHDYLDPDQLDATTLTIKSIILYNSAEATEGKNIYDNCTITASTCNNGEDCGMSGCSFEIDVPDGILDGEGIERDAYIVVLYDISLNENLGDFKDDVDEIDNWVNITFGARAIGIPEEVQTYSYGFKVFKYTNGNADEEGHIEQIALAGAEFVISKTNDSNIVYAKFILDEDDPLNGYTGSGIYLFDKWVESIDDATTLVSDSDGFIHVDGLHDGTFFITETKAPNGYNMLKDSIEVVITASNDLGNFTVSQDGEFVSDHQVNVLNNSGTILPGTGGIGTTIFYIIGTILVLGAAALIVARWRMGKSE